MTDEILIRPARGAADFDACIALQRSVWGLSDLDITSRVQLAATTFAGGSLLLAETSAGDPIGFAYAFASLRGGTPHLHSDMLAVLPAHRKRGIGAQLKWAQRDETLARGLPFVEWTFDPLEARNATLNLRRLGAQAVAFVEDFYGVTSSALHHGLPTDRLIVRWNLQSPRVVERAKRLEQPAIVDAPAFERINDVKWQAGWAVSSEPRLDLTDPALLLEIPPDFGVINGSAPRVAADWHDKVRRALRAYFAKGYVASDLAPTEERGRRRPFYVLTKA